MKYVMSSGFDTECEILLVKKTSIDAITKTANSQPPTGDGIS